MTFAVHASVGMLVGRFTGNPVLAFLAGVVSHFLLDMIPHGDEYLLHNYNKRHRVGISIAYVAVDSVVTIGMITYLLTQGIFSKSFSGFAGLMGAVGGLLPDLLVGIHELIPRKFKILERYVAFHHHNHHILIKKLFRERDANHNIALIGQGLFIVIFLVLVIR